MGLNKCACLISRDGEPMLFDGMDLDGELRGLLFEARLVQRFHNPGDEHVELVYTFPLPWGATLLDVEVALGQQELRGAVVEKRAAEAGYEDALAEGDAALLLERNHDLSYSLSLGNLGPGEACIIRLRYAQTLSFEQGGLRLLIPTVIAPRYGDPVVQGGLQPHQVPEFSLGAQYPFHLNLRLHGDLARGRIASPSHAVALKLDGTGAEPVQTVSLAMDSWLDRDFVLVVDELPRASLALAAADAPGQVAVLAGFQPRRPAQAPAPLTLKILVDCSGSMAGDSLEAARRALLAGVEQLLPADRFSLSRFGSSTEHRARGLWKAAPAALASARDWIQALEADLGGTEMEAALESTLALGGAAPADLLLVTDGKISAIDDLLATAQASAQRLFIVGVGASPAEAHLRRLAEVSGGACDFVAPGEAVEPALLRMFSRLRSPRLRDLRVEWPAAPDWITRLPAAVFDGDTVKVFACFARAPVGLARLLGRRDGGAEEEVLAEVELAAPTGEGDALARLAAAARLIEAGPEDALELALDYQLISERTSFLLVHAREADDKSTTMPLLQTVAQMLPAGWGGLGRTRRIAAPIVAAPAAESYLDIPLFCRRRMDDDEAPWPVDMTPLELHRRLRDSGRRHWPKSLQALGEFGLEQEVVSWLEELGAAAGSPEPVLVRTFLELMARPETRRALLKGADLDAGRASIGRWIRGLFKAPSRFDPALAETLLAAMAGMTADRWPEAVGQRRLPLEA